MNIVVRSILVVALVALVAPLHASAGQGKKTSPEERERMLALITTLELDPYNASAKDYRREVLEWLTEAPDVSVKLCANLLGDMNKYPEEERPIFVGQLAFSQAKFILQNPDKAKDDRAVNLAGVEGMLLTYVSMKTKKPNLTIEPIEKMIQMQADDKLAGYVEKTLKGCK